MTDPNAERDRIRQTYLHPDRPASSARGLHHTALVSGDVERTTRFYSELLEFPLTEMIDNRDYPGSTHFFFDIGNGNLLAFFDFPGLASGPYAEVLGGLHHVAISVEPALRQSLQFDRQPALRAVGRGEVALVDREGHQPARMQDRQRRAVRHGAEGCTPS